MVMGCRHRANRRDSAVYEMPYCLPTVEMFFPKAAAKNPPAVLAQEELALPPDAPEAQLVWNKRVGIHLPDCGNFRHVLVIANGGRAYRLSVGPVYRRRLPDHANTDIL